MSANKFKVGDRVKVRKDLKINHWYGDYLFSSFMATLVDEVDTVTGICGDGDAYMLNHYDIGWTNEMLEPTEKTLDNLCAGDLVVLGYEKRMILAAVDGCYLLSYSRMYEAADRWITAERLKIDGFEFFDPQSAVIEIDGKKYNKADVKKAIKDLESVD